MSRTVILDLGTPYNLANRRLAILPNPTDPLAVASPTVVGGTAATIGGSGNLVLTDSSKNFTTLGVLVGDQAVITGGTGVTPGTYTIMAVGTTTITLNTSPGADSSGDCVYSITLPYPTALNQYVESSSTQFVTLTLTANTQYQVVLQDIDVNGNLSRTDSLGFATGSGALSTSAQANGLNPVAGAPSAPWCLFPGPKSLDRLKILEIY